MSSEGSPADGVVQLELQGASVSVLAVTRDGGESIATSTPDRVLLPASNTKLITGGLALNILGASYTFETGVRGVGTVRGRTLEGDLTLTGSGAPDLTMEDLEKLAATVADEIDQVTGDLVLDETAFTGDIVGPGWTWQDVQHAYGAASSALALERNQVTVEVGGRRSSDGEPAICAEPMTTEISIDAAVETDPDAASGDVAGETDPCSGTVTIEGIVPTSASDESGGDPETLSVPVATPVRHCGEAFRDALRREGVTFDGGLRLGEVDDGTPAVAAAVESATVRDLLSEMNVSSDNFVAEQLARAVARVGRGEGSWAAWEEVVSEHFRALGHDHIRIRDGSGLSRYNLLSARALVDHLHWADNQAWSDAFFDSLPQPGEGTLDGRLDGIAVRAKTGTLTGSSALSGVLTREDMPDIVFSILQSGLTEPVESAARDRQDAFLEWLLDP